MDTKKSHKWSQQVTEESHALDLEKGIFTWEDPHKIAQSLKNSALKSTHRKGSAYQSAISMLNFYINRAGKKLNSHHKEILNKTKKELHQLFHK